MAALPPVALPPVALPLQPNDPNILLPPAPRYPPTIHDVLGAVKYRKNVDMSHDGPGCPVGQQCTDNDSYSSIVYEHSVVVQAAALDVPQAIVPPWLPGIIQQIRTDFRNDMRAIFLPDVKRLINQRRGDGMVIQYEIVPLPNGIDPTQPPYNLPGLLSVAVIENLDAHVVTQYLIDYGIKRLPVGENLIATDYLRKEMLKSLVRF